MKKKNVSIIIVLSWVLITFNTVICAKGNSFKNFSEINDMYYNLRQTSLEKFNSKATNDYFEYMKDKILPKLKKKYKEELKSIEFYVYYKNGTFQVKSSDFTTLGNKQSDAGMRQMIRGTKQMLNGFFMSWGEIVTKPIFAELSSLDKKEDIVKEKDRYKIFYEEGGSEVKMIMNTDFVIEKVKYTEKNNKYILLPEFVDTEQGLLLKKLKTKMPGYMEQVFKINYYKKKDIFLPKEVQVKINSFQGRQKQNIKLKFYDYNIVTKNPI